MKFCSSISRVSGILFIFLASLTAGAQNTTSSPYSRYGIGDLQFGGFTRNLGMGGLSYGLNNPFALNFSNPASYSSLLLTTYEAGFNSTFLQLQNSTGKGYADNVSFGYFAMAFPVKLKKWGMSFGLLPYSDVGYTITQEGINDNGDRQNLLFTGTGGLNQFYFGNAVNLTKSLSLGVNTSFLFGTIDQERRIYYPDGGYLNTLVTDQDIVNDFYFTFGLQQTFDSLKLAKSDSLVMYDKEKKKNNDSLKVIARTVVSTTDFGKEPNVDLSKLREAETSLLERNKQLDSLRSRVVKRRQRSDMSLTFGLTGAPSMKLRGKQTLLAENYLLDGLGNEVIRDTVVNESQNGRLVLPVTVGFGVTVKKGTNWLAGADFSLQNWQDYSLFGQSDSLANSWRVAVGAQLIPNDRTLKSYLNAVNYRVGFHYEQTYLNINNSKLNQMGVTVGMGFPVKRSASMIQIAVEAGKRGTTVNKLIEENYIKCSLGFTLNDKWFVKPKFD